MTELNSVSASEHIQALYRLLLIRTGQRIQAEQALRETLTESPQDIASDPIQTDFVEYYRTALKMPAADLRAARNRPVGMAARTSSPA